MGKTNTSQGIEVLLAVMVAVGCSGAPPKEKGAGPLQNGVQSEIADFVLKDVDGRSHALSDYLKRHVIAISFWATWCEPCKKELAKLQDLYSARASQGLIVLSISMDEPETIGEVRPFVKQRGITFPVLLDTESLVTNQLNPRRAAPYNLIIDRQGRVTWTHEGYVPGDEKKLEQAVLEALGSGP